MKRQNITLIASLILGVTLTPIASSFANNNVIETTIKDTKSVSITIKIDYLGEPTEGVTATLVAAGATMVEGVTDAKGRVTLKVDNYDGGAVDLQLMKEGYQTQILSGMLLRDGSKYVFSMVKGTGAVTTEISNNIDEIKTKSTETIEKSNQKAEDSKAKGESYSKSADEEAQKQKEAEAKAAQKKQDATEAAASSDKLESQLSESAETAEQREKQDKLRQQNLDELENQQASEEVGS